MKKGKSGWEVVYGNDIDISDIKKIGNSESYVKWNISFLAQCMLDENRIYVLGRSIQERYDSLFHQLVKAMGDLPGARLLKEYELLLMKENEFYDPYGAYLAGRQSRELVCFGKDESYGYYLKEIRESTDYQSIIAESSQLFDRIMGILKTEELQLAFIELIQLHANIYGILRKKMKIFFELGFDSAITFLDHNALANIINIEHSDW